MVKKKSGVVPKSIKIPADLAEELDEYLDLTNQGFSSYVINFIREDVKKNLPIIGLQKAKELEKKYTLKKKA